jgi:hypothetical protein
MRRGHETEVTNLNQDLTRLLSFLLQEVRKRLGKFGARMTTAPVFRRDRSPSFFVKLEAGRAARRIGNARTWFCRRLCQSQLPGLLGKQSSDRPFLKCFGDLTTGPSYGLAPFSIVARNLLPKKFDRFCCGKSKYSERPL